MRKILLLALKAGVSALLLYLALRNVDFSVVRQRLSGIAPGWFVLGFATILVQSILLALRWRVIVIECGANLPAIQAIRFTLIAAFFNQTLPSSVGGDAMRIWLLGKQENWRTAGYSVILDRVIGVVALAWTVLVCLPWTFEMITDQIARAALVLIGVGANAAALVFLGLATPYMKFLDRWTATRHLAAAAATAIAIVSKPKVFAPLFAISIFIHFLSAVTAWLIAQSTGTAVPLATMLFLLPPALLAAVIPVSVAGWGLREGALMVSFAYAGLAQSDALVVSLLFGVQYLAFGLACGLLWLLPSGPRPERPQSESP